MHCVTYCLFVCLFVSLHFCTWHRQLVYIEKFQFSTLKWINMYGHCMHMVDLYLIMLFWQLVLLPFGLQSHQLSCWKNVCVQLNVNKLNAFKLLNCQIVCHCFQYNVLLLFVVIIIKIIIIKHSNQIWWIDASVVKNFLI